jgi:hypothetical protein
VVVIGEHVIKTWSRTQKTVALSSGEAELTAMVKATCEGLGVSALAEDWGSKKRIVLYADSSAALGVVKRKGAGKLRHVKVGMLWVQEKREDNSVQFKKVDGLKNPADLMTKNNGSPTLDEHCRRLKLQEEAGRANKASNLAKGVQGR